MAGGGVGVLADDEHAHVGQRPLEGAQHLVAGGQVVASGRDLLAQEASHRLDPVLDRCQRLGPVRGDQAALDEGGQRAGHLVSSASLVATASATACCPSAKGWKASARDSSVRRPLTHGSSAQISWPAESA